MKTVLSLIGCGLLLTGCGNLGKLPENQAPFLQGNTQNGESRSMFDLTRNSDLVIVFTERLPEGKTGIEFAKWLQDAPTSPKVQTLTVMNLTVAEFEKLVGTMRRTDGERFKTTFIVDIIPDIDNRYAMAYKIEKRPSAVYIDRGAELIMQTEGLDKDSVSKLLQAIETTRAKR